MSAESNKAVIQQYFAAQNAHDLDAIFTYISPASISYSVPQSTEPQGIDGIKRYFTALHEVMPDLHTTVHDSIAEGDRVAVRFTVSGTLSQDFMGDTAGQQVNWYIFTFYRLENGKIVEVWSH